MRRRPLVALRALRKLVNDPESTGEVFVVMRALSGNAISRGCARFRRTPTGKRVLASREEIVPVLADRARLATLPEGSLGRRYLALVERAGITPQGLIEASDEVASEYAALAPDEAIYARRLRDTHDLWHAATGYDTDPFGEVCLVAFSYAQTRNLGFAAIALMGTLKLVRESGDTRVVGAVWRAYRDGARAGWLPGVDWQAALHEGLERVRAELRIAPPERYLLMRRNLDPQPA